METICKTAYILVMTIIEKKSQGIYRRIIKVFCTNCDPGVFFERLLDIEIEFQEEMLGPICMTSKVIFCISILMIAFGLDLTTKNGFRGICFRVLFISRGVGIGWLRFEHDTCAISTCPR